MRNSIEEDEEEVSMDEELDDFKLSDALEESFMRSKTPMDEIDFQI